MTLPTRLDDCLAKPEVPSKSHHCHSEGAKRPWESPAHLCELVRYIRRLPRRFAARNDRDNLRIMLLIHSLLQFPPNPAMITKTFGGDLMATFGFIGIGNMGGAIAVAASKAHDPADIWVSAGHPQKAAEFPVVSVSVQAGAEAFSVLRVALSAARWTQGQAQN